MVKTRGLHLYSDEHYTPPEVALDIVRFFRPHGHTLEPFVGDGAFRDALVQFHRERAGYFGALSRVFWCDLEEGFDFFAWDQEVNWIVTNPPYSILTDVMRHCFEVAQRTVLLVPMSKIYSSAPRMELVRRVAGIESQYVLGVGRELGFNSGFPFAAIQFTRGYHGPATTHWKGNS